MWLLDELKLRENDNNTAIIHRDNRITYAELWTRSDDLAAWMKNNLSTKAPVLIYGDKDIEIVEIMIAALKTGRAYIPVDITFPPERVRMISDITKAEIIFDIAGSLNSDDFKDVNLLVQKEDLPRMIAETADTGVSESDWVKGDDTCYILFTSGSTGTPKGVQISRNNIINFVDWYRKHGSVDGGVALNQVSYSFDISVIQLYMYMPSGTALYCIDKEMIVNFRSLFENLQKSGISAWVSTPAFMEMCALNDGFDRTLLPNLDKISLMGEVLTKKLVKLLWEKLPGVKVINGYGPTEGTVLLTQTTITEEMIKDEKELPIGYVLDDGEYFLDPVEGEESYKGELVISTKSLSKGYYNNPEITERSFIVKEGKRYYRTGDIVYEENGMLYFCGRRDFQIKLNGYRIELDDVSENINRIKGVSSNVVIPVMNDGKIKNLAAFVKLVSVEGGVETGLQVRKELAKLIPSYMIPKKIVIVQEFPLNVNGKIDRKALAEEYL